MLKISKQQALNRLGTLPANLKEALFSEYNGETLWRICQSQHLSEDKIEKVAGLAGDVILGFLHSEDLAEEIKKEINLAPEIAKAIAAEIDRKIFAPIRSDLKKVYSPIVTLTKEGVSPSIKAEEIGVEERGRETIKSERPAGVEIKKPEAPIKIIEEENKFGESAVSFNERLTAQKAEQPKIIAFEEKFEEKIEEKKDEKPFTASAVESPNASNVEPFILHKEIEFKPLLENKKSLKSLGGLFGFIRKKEKTEEIKPVKAELEGIGINSLKEKDGEIKSLDNFKESVFGENQVNSLDINQQKLFEQSVQDKSFDNKVQDKPLITEVKIVNYTQTPELSAQSEFSKAAEAEKLAKEDKKEEKKEEIIDLSNF